MADDDWMEIQAILSNELSKADNAFYKADILRSIMAIKSMAISPSGNGPTWAQEDEEMAVTEEDWRKYVRLVDDMSGINNYAEDTLSLCKTTRNESGSWSSGLTVEDVLSFLPDGSRPAASDWAALSDAMPRCADAAPSASSPRLEVPVFDLGMETGEAAVVSLSEPPSAVNGRAPDGVKAGRAAPRPQGPTPGFLFSGGVAEEPDGTPGRGGRSCVARGAVPPRTGAGRSVLVPTMASATTGYNVAGQVRSLMGHRAGSAASGPRGDGSGPGHGPIPSGGGRTANSDDRQNYRQRARGHGKRARGAWGNTGGDDDGDETASAPAFKTAKDQLITSHLKSKGYTSEQAQKVVTSASYGGKKNLGARRGFVPPVKEPEDDGAGVAEVRRRQRWEQAAPQTELDERLKNIEPRMVELIQAEIMDHGPPVAWDDIAGLEFAKNTIKGLPKGLLLFGPPGTGKTLIGKCIASQSQSTFFSISASSLTSKWIGEGEKMVRALFAVARCHQPAVVFIDEIDSLLSQRSESEHESSRRIKTEFLIQLDGAGTSGEDRLLVVGATNRPQELDEAARRRLVKRLYVPLPDQPARRQIVTNLLQRQRHQLTGPELDRVAAATDGYSGADVTNLCREAALGPIRCIAAHQIHHITPEQVRPLIYGDFEAALENIRASVSSEDLQLYTDWNRRFGTGGARR